MHRCSGALQSKASEWEEAWTHDPVLFNLSNSCIDMIACTSAAVLMAYFIQSGLWPQTSGRLVVSNFDRNPLGLRGQMFLGTFNLQYNCQHITPTSHTVFRCGKPNKAIYYRNQKSTCQHSAWAPELLIIRPLMACLKAGNLPPMCLASKLELLHNF